MKFATFRQTVCQGAAERAALGQRLRDLVRRDHEVDALMQRLCARMGADR